MDINELINLFNKMLDLGDSFDNSGVFGVKALTDGECTTRDTTRLELGQFLIYIADGNGTFEEVEVALINVVLGCDYNAAQLKQFASSANEPNPSACMTLMGYLSADIVFNQQNGTRSTQTSDSIISAFETFGNLMVALDDNPVSKARCAKYINGMKSYVKKKI